MRTNNQSNNGTPAAITRNTTPGSKGDLDNPVVNDSSSLPTNAEAPSPRLSGEQAVGETPKTNETSKNPPQVSASDIPNRVLCALENMDDMDKIEAIGELSHLNEQLSQFMHTEISEYDPQKTPPDREELLKKWNKYSPPAFKNNTTKELAHREIFQKLDQVEIELSRNYELSRIDQARQNWNQQLTTARTQADEENIAHWEQLGKGIFYPEQEETRQQQITQRFSRLKNVQDMLGTQPAKALEYLEAEENTSDFPPTVKTYWQTRAKQALAEKQESFYKSMIENELRGTPYKEDILDKAEQQQLIAPDRKKAYLERFTPERPLRNEASMATPFMNTLHDLINSYSPEQDIRGERKRSIYALIAESDCPPEEKSTLIREFAKQRNNPDLARLKNEAQLYLKSSYERDGFGEFQALSETTLSPFSQMEQTPEKNMEAAAIAEKENTWRNHLSETQTKAWLASEEKLKLAQNALNDYLNDNSNQLPTRQEWKTLLPQIIHQATRTPKRLFEDDIITYQGYPLLLEESPTRPSPGKNTPQPPPTKTNPTLPQPSQSWKETLSQYFSTNPNASLKNIRTDLNSLYSQWLNRKKDVSTPNTSPTIPEKTLPN